MSAFFNGQVFRDVLWATPLPVTVRIGSEQERVRVRGVVSVGVVDADRMDETVSDPNALEPRVRQILADAVSDAIAENSQAVSDVNELMEMDEKLKDTVLQKAEAAFKEMGMNITSLEVQAIETV